MLSSTLLDIKRKLGNSPRQAIPVLPSMLTSIFSYLTTNAGHNVWRAAMLCCFRGFLRKCQVTQSDSTLRKDFDFFQWGLLITVRKSKSIQFQDRLLKIPISRCPNKDLCAVYWCERQFTEIPAGKDELTFRIPSIKWVFTLNLSHLPGDVEIVCF